MVPEAVLHTREMGSWVYPRWSSAGGLFQGPVSMSYDVQGVPFLDYGPTHSPLHNNIWSPSYHPNSGQPYRQRCPKWAAPNGDPKLLTSFVVGQVLDFFISLHCINMVPRIHWASILSLAWVRTSTMQHRYGVLIGFLAASPCADHVYSSHALWSLLKDNPNNHKVTHKVLGYPKARLKR